MFDHFGFVPSEMSDDELLERWNFVTSKMVWAARFGSGELLDGLRNMRMQIEFEQRDRMIGTRQRRMAQMPSVMIETDPGLARIERDKVEAIVASQAPKTTTRRLPIAPTPQERLKPSAKPQAD